MADFVPDVHANIRAPFSGAGGGGGIGGVASWAKTEGSCTKDLPKKLCVNFLRVLPVLARNLETEATPRAPMVKPLVRFTKVD